ncbi:probable Pre-mRNA-splicing factor CWC24 [Ustilago trichophora]|uniref:Pre-mRNA-splicing factor CWC24 n=1 Tax=Ustilago trichophora TaxID=86804 RepID=A0A5C3E9H6_9BASI|nr:probable Pre-mRNA-splicing factor CWC24 [Ustilago trichophora]
MEGSEGSGAATSPVIFKRKRGIASRPATSTSTLASTSSNNAAAGPSRASHSLSNGRPTRSDSDSDEEGSGPLSSSLVIKKKKRTNHNPLVQSTGSVLRRSKLGGDSDDDESYKLDEESSTRSSGTTRTINDSLQKIRNDATKHSDWDLDTASSTSKDATPSTSSNADGLYRGSKSYTSYITARDDGTSSKMRSRGPIRQTTTVRTTSLMDYQPDICKDYKETGYCGFGDTCKFLHDRSDYLAGWQLDVMPNSSNRTRENLLSDPEAEEEEQVPFACLICRQPFTDPITTRCGHYFCSSCAIKRFAKNSKCFACGAQTGGLFNSATKILEKMEKAKQRKMQIKTERDSWKLDDKLPISEFGHEAGVDDA